MTSLQTNAWSQRTRWHAYTESTLILLKYGSLAFQDPPPGLEELGEPGHGLLLHRNVAPEDIHVLDHRWPVHIFQQHLAGQGVREGIWLTAACQRTLLAGKQVSIVASDASNCSGPQGQKERGLFPREPLMYGWVW